MYLQVDVNYLDWSQLINLQLRTKIQLLLKYAKATIFLVAGRRVQQGIPVLWGWDQTSTTQVRIRWGLSNLGQREKDKPICNVAKKQKKK